MLVEPVELRRGEIFASIRCWGLVNHELLRLLTAETGAPFAAPAQSLIASTAPARLSDQAKLTSTDKVGRRKQASTGLNPLVRPIHSVDAQ